MITNTWILPLLVVTMLSSKFAVEAFVVSPSTSPVVAASKNIARIYNKQYYSVLLQSRNNDDNGEDDDAASNERRGLLKSIIGGALSMAATDTLVNAAITTISGNPVTAKLYQRILSFGSRYSGAGAVASTDLTAFVASQRGHLPEVQAWLAAQKKLQSVFRSTTTMAATTTAGRTAMKQTARGGIVEEVLAVTAAIKARQVFSKQSPSSNIEKSSNTTGIESSLANNTGIDDAEVDCEEEL